jgi:uncharacterized protein DUF4019
LPEEDSTVKYKFLVVVLTILMAAPFVLATESDSTSRAKEAATAWLALVDSGKYAESWDAASSYFKGAITKDDWTRALGSVRSPLGKVKSRKLKSADFTRTLPGAPDGQYVVIQYETEFENKAASVETITPALDKDGSWKVSGYYIK